MGIFSNYIILNESNVSFIKGYSLHFLPAERRASHDAAIKVMKDGKSAMELEIVKNLDHSPSFDEIMNNAKVVSHISKKHKDYSTIYNTLVGFEYHYYDIIINFISNKDDDTKELLIAAGDEYVKKLKNNPSLSQIRKFEPRVKLPVKENTEIIDDFEFDDYF